MVSAGSGKVGVAVRIGWGVFDGFVVCFGVGVSSGPLVAVPVGSNANVSLAVGVSVALARVAVGVVGGGAVGAWTTVVGSGDAGPPSVAAGSDTTGSLTVADGVGEDVAVAVGVSVGTCVRVEPGFVALGLAVAVRGMRVTLVCRSADSVGSAVARARIVELANGVAIASTVGGACVVGDGTAVHVAVGDTATAVVSPGRFIERRGLTGDAKYVVAARTMRTTPAPS